MVSRGGLGGGDLGGETLVAVAAAGTDTTRALRGVVVTAGPGSSPARGVDEGSSDVVNGEGARAGAATGASFDFRSVRGMGRAASGGERPASRPRVSHMPSATANNSAMR